MLAICLNNRFQLLDIYYQQKKNLDLLGGLAVGMDTFQIVWRTHEFSANKSVCPSSYCLNCFPLSTTGTLLFWEGDY